jgi:hypothetical protein
MDPQTGQPVMAPMQTPPAPPLPVNPRPPQAPQQQMDPQLQQRTSMMQNMLDQKDQNELAPTAIESADDLKSQGMAMKAAAIRSAPFAAAAPNGGAPIPGLPPDQQAAATGNPALGQPWPRPHDARPGPRTPMPTRATAEGILQSVREGAFGAHANPDFCIREALCWLIIAPGRPYAG